MNTAPLLRSYVDAWRIWSGFGLRFSETLFASSQVIAHRTDRMRAAHTTPRADDREEFALMKQEKVDAALESAQAMALESILAGQRYAAFTFRQFFAGMPALLSLALPGTPRQLSARQIRLVRNTVHQTAMSTNKLSVATGKIVQRGLTPIRKRATANAKRLKRVR
ncbi:MAG TPA: polyhydroxyalkanoate granule-associated phasin [Burkholderiales bacterium]